MRRPPFAYPRAETQARIVARVEVGWTVRALAREPGFPCVKTVMRWRREDEGFAQRLAGARNLRNGVWTEARWARTAFDPVRAEAFLLEVRRGTPVEALLRRPEWPSRRGLNAWKRQRPAFAAEILEAARFSQSFGRRRWQFDWTLADEIVRRVHRGETLAAVSADPGLPGPVSLARWRRERPEFDAALRLAAKDGFRRLRRARGAPPPQVVKAIVRHIRRGGSISSAVRQPGMPGAATVYRWRDRWPDFARDLYWAQVERDERLRDQALMIAETCTPETIGAARARLADIYGRLGRMTPKPRR
jgi:transposase-like protein